MVNFSFSFMPMILIYWEVVAVVSKEMGLEVNADTTKYMIMSRDQNA